jgi:hypothetical protein
MISVHSDGGRTLFAALLCAICLSGTLAPASRAASPNPANLPGGCGPRPSWIETATLPEEGQAALSACFSSKSNQAEALLNVANNRPYAQLITVSGTSPDLAESSFARSLEGALARLLASSSSGTGTSAFLLGPGERAALAIDRPPPGPAEELHIDPAPDNAFAVAALAWRLLSTAAQRVSLPAATESCIAAAVYGALASPPHPELALERMHFCINAAGLSRIPEQLLRELASRLLRDRFFQEVIEREGTEPHPARIALTTSPSNPDLIDPEIHLGSVSLEASAGQRTVEHLSATGGVPPYRYYIIPEPGGPGVPSWFHLAADGTLTLEPPAGASQVDFLIDVIDANGESEVPY